MGISVVVIRPGTMEAIFKDLNLIGSLTGQTAKAEALVTSLRSRVQAVTDKVSQVTAAKPSILYVTWHDPIWTAGDDTIIGELIRIVGGVNIASDLSGYATLTLEQVVQRTRRSLS